MKGPIELSNFAFEYFSSKCTTPSETEDEGEVTVQMWEMYGKMFSSECFSMMLLYYSYFMHSKAVELEELYLDAK